MEMERGRPGYDRRLTEHRNPDPRNHRDLREQHRDHREPHRDPHRDARDHRGGGGLHRYPPPEASYGRTDPYGTDRGPFGDPGLNLGYFP